MSAALRRPGHLRHHRRPGQEDDLPVAVPAGGAAGCSTARSSAWPSTTGPTTTCAATPASPSAAAGEHARRDGVRPVSRRGCATCRVTSTTPATYDAAGAAIGGARRPCSTWRSRRRCSDRSSSGCTTPASPTDARVVVEKPFGHDLASAQALNEELHTVHRRGADLPHRPLPRQAVGRGHPVPAVRQHHARAGLEPPVRVAACRSRWPRTSAWRTAARSTTRSARCATSCRTTCCRCSAWSRWSRRPALGSTTLQRPQAATCSAPCPTVDPHARRPRPVRRLPRRAGRRPDSTTETFARCGCRSTTGAGPGCRSSSGPARRCRRRSPRCASSSTSRRGSGSPPRTRTGPRPTSWSCASTRCPAPVSCWRRRPPDGDGLRDVHLDMDFASEGGEGPTPYEVLLSAPCAANRRDFARQDAVEETWRIVQPLLDAPPPVDPVRTGLVGPGGGRCPDPLPRRLAPGPGWADLQSRVRPPGDRVRGVDEPDVGERLRHVAQHPPGCRVVLLAEQADVVAQGEQAVEHDLRSVAFSDQGQALHEPERADEERALPHPAVRRGSRPSGSAAAARRRGRVPSTACTVATMRGSSGGRKPTSGIISRLASIAVVP